ncbi:hypothetical protein ACFRJ9_14470 [Paenarthrobacter sp. NPDC056912]|uniref:hypothetical protein n=1 Tax=Paenarthrobacter sp. NPDC056912 TaxID=3345965 RepID=UPI00366F52FD
MNSTQIGNFLRETVAFEDDTDEGLDLDTLYGLYLSWCALGRKIPIPDSAFETGLQVAGCKRVRHNGVHIYRGLVMVGPAARDFAVTNTALWADSTEVAALGLPESDQDDMPHTA